MADTFYDFFPEHRACSITLNKSVCVIFCCNFLESCLYVVFFTSSNSGSLFAGSSGEEGVKLLVD